ncbi:sulfite exporter TauE/SafE family protein [Amphritea sp. HPY]|uniref:sulfite exporter TauE/SafE family protein n=1 Tax=Amphritea sp. HPY TaxID=3421652 RepID=UPI003D7CA517
MEPIEWIALTSIVAIAGMVRGCIGFGFSSLVVASATLFMSPLSIVPMLALLEIAASIHMAFSTWRDAALRPLGFMLLGALVATPMGIYVLVILPAEDVSLIVAGLILVLSLLLLSGWQYRGKSGAMTYTGLGIVSGVCNGAAAVGGLPVAAFLTASNLSMRALRATLVLFFFGTDVILLFSASGHGLFTEQLLVQSGAMLLPMVVGIHFGGVMFNRIPERRLRTGVIYLLLLLSIIGISRSLIMSVG